MRLLLICLLAFPVYLSAQTYQLASPQIRSDAWFFKTATQVELALDLEQTELYYTLIKDSERCRNRYTKPLRLTQSTRLRAVARHPEFAESEVAERQFLRVRHTPANMQLLTPPNQAYPGAGASSLWDLKKGGADIHDGQWLGFLCDTLVMEASFTSKISFKQLIFSTLDDAGAWILPMRAIHVWGKSSDGEWKKIGDWEAADDKYQAEYVSNYADFKAVPLQNMRTDQLRIVVVPFGPLPDGHPNAGSLSWLFLDEIVFQ